MGEVKIHPGKMSSHPLTKSQSDRVPEHCERECRDEGGEGLEHKAT